MSLTALAAEFVDLAVVGADHVAGRLGSVVAQPGGAVGGRHPRHAERIAEHRDRRCLCTVVAHDVTNSTAHAASATPTRCRRLMAAAFRSFGGRGGALLKVRCQDSERFAERTRKPIVSSASQADLRRSSAARTRAESVVDQNGGSEARRNPGVPCRRHPRVEHRDDAPVVDAAQQPARALGEQQRGVAGGHGHEPVAAVGGDGALPRRDQRIVGPGERNPVDQHQRQGRAGHVDALPQRQRAEQRRLVVLGEPADQGRRGVLALTQHRGVEAVAHRLGGGLGRAHRREQAERATTRRGDQALDLVELLGGPGAVTARRWQVRGDVEDAGLGVRER